MTQQTIEPGPWTAAIASELRAAAARRMVTYADIARASGYSTTTISRMMRGTRTIGQDQYMALCAAIGVHPGRIALRGEAHVPDGVPIFGPMPMEDPDEH